ncbi:Light-harvesting Chl a protein 5 [Guillardia theta CCMP2712]|uniref:Light-harvesting Chl a protein 5 n=1 Tax=Guillardia theta (strain CCMP2712) TaxID=905079 RepID=L1JK78_GUITC|nr:Light-harvesting Chl a protein 5 [Guillardia theta CCMP2712]EKX48559.1 Light-harvesting Chl a protein 5 [Guillardia theta CCMP2712]|eukprot:XP_005835539.1 Light-harvesting Chl a protein 5 [Guillardia theta CCMP2712]
MLRVLLLAAVAASASAFAPSSLLPATRRAGNAGISMQLFGDGKIQGKGVTAIPFAGRPNTPAFDGTWAGDVGFDPLTISGWLDIKWLREAELKHCRVAMLAVAGCIAQDLFRFPGAETVYSSDLKLTKLHDAALKTGTMGQMLFWLGSFEAISTAAVIQMLQGSGRKPGDFGFDPLGLGKGGDRARLELAEIKNGRLAMIAFSGIIHHYFITGKGPIELITGK